MISLELYQKIFIFKIILKIIIKNCIKNKELKLNKNKQNGNVI